MTKHILFVMVVFAVTAAASFFYLDFLARAQTMPLVCTSYDYSAWGTCTSGQQSRNILAQYPASCTDTSTAQLTQTCLACTSYTYKNLGACVGNNSTREIDTQSPAGCTDTSSAQLTVPCTMPLACNNYTYNAWGSCNAGQRSHTIATQSPAGCTDTSSAVLTEICPGTVACTSYTYNQGTCVNGNMSQTIATQSPAGCTDTSSAILIVPCTDLVPCTGYTYTTWSGCNADGKQTRSIATYTPPGCLATDQGSLTPELLTQQCTVCGYNCGGWSAVCNANHQKTRTCTPTPTGCVPPSATSTIPAAQSDCETVVCTSFTYNDWSTTCNSAGKRTRTIKTQLPAGCTDTTGAELTQTCPVCVYKYGSWSTTCNAAGLRTRSYTATPAGCFEATAPILKESCAGELKCSTYTYNDWGACNTNGKQIRSIATKLPVGCVDTTGAVLTRDCDSPCTSYTYGAWGNCINGKQTRAVVSKSPDQCREVTLPLIEQGCVIQAGTTTDPVVEKVEIPAKNEPCIYNYSAWADCVGGKKVRMVISKSPENCDGSAAPELEQGCVVSMPVVILRPADAPVPAPESVATVTASVAEPQNLNDRTGVEWQKYYFGTENCLDQKVCAGFADPDFDGLSNNEEYRFGTDPKVADTDHDGMGDAQEIVLKRNPLVAEFSPEGDKIVFESPKDKGNTAKDIYQVKTVQMVKKGDGLKTVKIGGKALPNVYVTIYLFSEPIVLTVKTDEDGNWSYVLDKALEEGNHEVYVAVTDNTGKVVAKSEPLAFALTAQAATVTPPKEAVSPQTTASPVEARRNEGYLIVALFVLAGFVLTLTSIGMIKGMIKKQ